MPASGLMIMGVGLGSHLGGAVQAAAAARAGIQRLRPIPGFDVHDPESDEMVPLSGFAATAITHGFEGRGRLLQLAVAALQDLHDSTPALASMRRPALVLLLHGSALERLAARRQIDHDGEDELDGIESDDADRRAELADLPQALAGLVPWLRPTTVSVLFGEHAGLAAALRQAETWLTEGACDGCLIGAIDSTIDPQRLPMLLAGDLLATLANPHAFTGGEAGAFLLLASGALAGQPLARLGPVATGKDDHMNEATALAQVLHDSLTRLAGRRSGLILDHTGETWRFATHGHAVARLAGAYPDLGNRPGMVIGEIFGELGPATGVVGCILACRSFVRGYSPAESALISLSDHDGSRASVIVHAPEGGQP